MRNKEEHRINFVVSEKNEDLLIVPLLIDNSYKRSISLDVGVRSIYIPLHTDPISNEYFMSFRLNFNKDVAESLGLGQLYTDILPSSGGDRQQKIDGLYKKGYQLNWDERCIISIWGVNKIDIQKGATLNYKNCFSFNLRSETKGNIINHKNKIGQDSIAEVLSCEYGVTLANVGLGVNDDFVNLMITVIEKGLGYIPFAGPLLAGLFSIIAEDKGYVELINGVKGVKDLDIYNEYKDKFIDSVMKFFKD
ncbi:hypothetical protein AYI68_g5523 [Smittium mucronatum]|uniref:Uncharacterized protein n=1 Tax=Smittium mucronatum TaxID=133383 RepID=A0A1R0GU61_9FUNG|nr:hypothetical protein AYI68_g5523 [Smittium mucronatum]